MTGNSILLSTIGSMGDVLPCLWLAQHLKRQGIRVGVLVEPGVVRKFEDAGFETIPVGESIGIERRLSEEAGLMKPGAGLLVLERLILPFTRTLFEAAKSAMERWQPDCLVVHSLAFGAIWAAWSKGVPTAVVHLQPCSWLCRTELLREIRPRWLCPILSRFFWSRVAQGIGARVAATARDLGVPVSPDFLRRTTLGADLVLGLWSRTLRPGRVGDPEAGMTCGFPLPPREGLSPEIQRFLEADDPVIGVGFGSSGSAVARPLYRVVAEACERLGCRGLFLGGSDPLPLDSPSSILWTSYAPYGEVVPRCSAFVHHGGIGTSALAMRAGVPAVAVPFGSDQFNNAAHAKHLGVSLTLHGHRLRVSPLVRNLKQVLSSEFRARVRALGDRFRQEEDGSVVAARAIVSTFGLRRNELESHAMVRENVS